MIKKIQDFVLQVLWSAAAPVYRSKYNPIKNKVLARRIASYLEQPYHAK